MLHLLQSGVQEGPALSCFKGSLGCKANLGQLGRGIESREGGRHLSTELCGAEMLRTETNPGPQVCGLV